MCAPPVYHGSQRIWQNEKVPRIHTNTLNPPASSMSPSEGVCSHGGALPLPEGLLGCSQGIMLRLFPPLAQLSEDVRRTDRRGGRKLKRGDKR